MKELVSKLWFRILLFIVFSLISYFMIRWYFSLPEIVDGNGENLRCAAMVLSATPLFFTFHILFSFRYKEMLFLRSILMFLCSMSLLFLILLIVGSLKYTEGVTICYLFLQIFFNAMGDPKLINEKIDKEKEKKQWEFTPMA